MARHLGLPERICAAVPTTDTYSLPQGQDEFYFALPYREMDLALWALNHDVPAAELGARARDQRGTARSSSTTTSRTSAARRATCTGRRCSWKKSRRWIY